MREEVTPTNKFVYQHLFLPKISPKAARGCWRGGGRVSPPKKTMERKHFFAKNSFDGTTAAAGRQGVLEGGGEGGVTPPQKRITNKFVFAEKLTEGATAFAGLQGVLERGRNGGDPGEALPPLKMFQFFQKLSPKGPLLPQAARGCWRRRWVGGGL